MRNITQIFSRGSATPLVFQELDRIEHTLIIIFNFLSYNLPEICHVLFDWLTIVKISRGRWVHPSLMAGKDHTVFALEGRNLVVEAMLTAIEDSNMTLAVLLVGRVCINCMSIWCLVGVSFAASTIYIDTCSAQFWHNVEASTDCCS